MVTVAAQPSRDDASEPDEEQRLQFRFVTSASGLPALQAGVKRVE